MLRPTSRPHGNSRTRRLRPSPTRTPTQADHAARTAGAAVRAGTLDELLDSAAETFDAVIVTTPPATHAALVQRAVQAGMHTLVESPLAPTAGEAHQVAAAARAAGVRLMLAHPARFQADHRAVKDSLDDGELGRPGLLRIHQWFSATDGSERAAHAGLAALGPGAVDVRLACRPTSTP